MTDTIMTGKQLANLSDPNAATEIINALNDLYLHAVIKRNFHTCKIIREEVRKLVSNDNPPFKLYSPSSLIPFKLD